MQLALIRRRYSPLGGAELYTQRLMQGLLEHGHGVHLFTEQWDNLPRGVVRHVIPSRGSRAARPRLFAAAVRRRLDNLAFNRVLSLERTLRQDVYRAGDGVHAAWLHRRRQHTSWWKAWWPVLSGFHRTMLNLESLTFNPGNTGQIIVNSDMVRREIIEHYQFPDERIQLIRNGINTQRFHPGHRESGRAVRKRLGIPADQYVALFAGSGWERKGLSFALKALTRPECADVVLVVVGRGRLPNRRPPNVIVAGPVPNPEVFYAAADVFLFLPIYEPSANVCFEALASGLPVITTRYDGASEVLETGKTGTVIDDPADTQSVVSALNHWRSHRPQPIDPAILDLSIERNVEETIGLLEST